MASGEHHGAQVLEVAGEALLLLAQKAVLWPKESMLIVADIHFGKAAAFRALGVPVPHGTTRENLDLLDRLILLHGVRHLVFLGDFLHAKAARAPATLAAMTAWRARHPALTVTLVRGNHDLHAGDPPDDLRIDVVDEPWLQAPFAFCHHPDLAAPGYVLAGHVHPVYRLASGREALTLPCFVFGATRAVLPSFGAFTGGHSLRPAADEALFLVAGDAVFARGG
jgi:DNA ligase-associated metallophosphoesterase